MPNRSVGQAGKSGGEYHQAPRARSQRHKPEPPCGSALDAADPDPRYRRHQNIRFTLLTCQLAKTRWICSAAAKCSNQADLYLTFIDPI